MSTAALIFDTLLYHTRPLLNELAIFLPLCFVPNEVNRSLKMFFYAVHKIFMLIDCGVEVLLCIDHFSIIPLQFAFPFFGRHIFSLFNFYIDNYYWLRNASIFAATREKCPLVTTNRNFGVFRQPHIFFFRFPWSMISKNVFIPHGHWHFFFFFAPTVSNCYSADWWEFLEFQCTA